MEFTKLEIEVQVYLQLLESVSPILIYYSLNLAIFFVKVLSSFYRLKRYSPNTLVVTSSLSPAFFSR